MLETFYTKQVKHKIMVIVVIVMQMDCQWCCGVLALLHCYICHVAVLESLVEYL